MVLGMCAVQGISRCGLITWEQAWFHGKQHLARGSASLVRVKHRQDMRLGLWLEMAALSGRDWLD